jgi:site-specific DNA-methyltransferase (adenine-specific)
MTTPPETMTTAASVTLVRADSLLWLPTLPADSVDAVVTDPPYALSFQGKEWDTHGSAHDFQAWCEKWGAECLRVLKPGSHLVAMGSTRTHHRLTCGLEDAGFEIRDEHAWVHSQGFPKSLDVSKAIDKAAGAKRRVVGSVRTNTGMRGGNFGAGSKTAEVPVTAPATSEAAEWAGWSTALKPSHEPIVLARKPLVGTLAENVLRYRTGALNVDACRIAAIDAFGGGAKGTSGFAKGYEHNGWTPGNSVGRWPANVVLDEEAAALLDEVASVKGGASRFFYVAKASKRDRGEGNTHPTVKPQALMRWLLRLVVPPGGLVLDPFCGSGTTLLACADEGFSGIGIEREPSYFAIAVRRLGLDGFDGEARTEDLGELRPDDTVFGDGEDWDKSLMAGVSR